MTRSLSSGSDLPGAKLPGAAIQDGRRPWREDCRVGLDSIPMMDQTQIHYCDLPTASTRWSMFLCPYNPKQRILHGQSEAEFL